jgi:hypothetical protein
MDKEGRVIYYPCNMGGEPLVIYSVVDGKPITSKSTFYPVYLKEGYLASPLTIPDFETTEEVSNNDLIIQTINPPAAFLSVDLSRKDGIPFYVDTANFPVADVIPCDDIIVILCAGSAFFHQWLHELNHRAFAHVS